MSSPLRDIAETLLVAAYDETVGTVVHELGHYIVAKVYGLDPELHFGYIMRYPGHDFAVGVAGGLAEALSLLPVRKVLKSDLAKTVTDVLIVLSVLYAFAEGLGMTGYKGSIIAFALTLPLIVYGTVKVVRRWAGDVQA